MKNLLSSPRGLSSYTKAWKLTRHYKFYDIYTLMVELPGNPVLQQQGESFSKEGDWIGSTRWAYRLVHRYGIEHFEKTKPEHEICSIGFAPKSQKWFGWSHRAIYGFQVGDIVEEGDLTASSGMTEEGEKLFPEDNLSLPIGFEARTLEDCKRMATAFAMSVS